MKTLKEGECEANDERRKLKDTFVIDSNKIVMLN